MNETFSLNRFLQYAKIRFYSQKLFYLSPLFIVGLSLFVILSDMIFDGMSGITQEMFLLFCCGMPFVFFGIFYSSRSYSDFHNRSKGFILSTIPASTFEKFLFGLLQNTLLLGVLFSIGFFISLLLVVGYNSIIPGNHKELYNALLSFTNVNTINDAPLPSPLNFRTFVNEILAFGTLYGVGSIIFKRISPVYTTLILTGILWIVINVIGLMFCGKAWGCPDTLDFIFAPIRRQDIVISKLFIWGIIAFYFTMLLLWFAMYHRLKEKEY